MTIIVDNGTNQTFECEIELDIEPKESNYIVFIPVRNETNLLELNYNIEGKFNYKKEESKKTLIFVIILIIVFCLIGVILIIYFALQ